MGIFDGLFKKREIHNPEDDFVVTITETFVRIEHPQRKTEQVLWENIELIKLINTDEGPWFPDVWMALLGKEDGCLIPQGAKGFEAIFDIVSKYDGFNLDNFIESMSCAENAEFLLWTKQQSTTI